MLYINKITADPQQQITLTGIPAITIALTLRFMPRIRQWIMGVQTGTQNIQGIAVTTSPNMLRQFRHVLPFGIACLTASGLDPFTINDFSNQASNLYLLNAADVALLEAEMFPVLTVQPALVT